MKGIWVHPLELSLPNQLRSLWSGFLAIKRHQDKKYFVWFTESPWWKNIQCWLAHQKFCNGCLWEKFWSFFGYQLLTEVKNIPHRQPLYLLTNESEMDILPAGCWISHMNPSRELCISVEIFNTRYEKFKYLNKYITIHNILWLHVT